MDIRTVPSGLICGDGLVPVDGDWCELWRWWDKIWITIAGGYQRKRVVEHSTAQQAQHGTARHIDDSTDNSTDTRTTTVQHWRLISKVDLYRF